MKFVIFKREGDQLGAKLGSYESDFKDDTSKNRNYDQAEPLACHIQVPEGMDVDCVIPEWMELEPEQMVTLREPTEELEGLYHTIPAVMGWGLVEDSVAKTAKRQAKANANLDAIRLLREPLLLDADHSINSAEDDNVAQVAVSLRAWRKALRQCTDDLKKQNGDAKLSCENLVPEEFEFPAKPE